MYSDCRGFPFPRLNFDAKSTFGSKFNQGIRNETGNIRNDAKNSLFPRFRFSDFPALIEIHGKDITKKITS